MSNTSQFYDDSSVVSRLELPTWALLVASYSSWFLLTWYSAALPWWLLLLLGGFIVGLYGSLQHEALHGHPTHRAWLNKALVWLPLGLWMPYTIYRDSHIAHHRCERLTDPVADPESFYVLASRWKQLSRPARAVLKINNTLAGRLLIGPAVVVAQFWTDQARQLNSGDRRYAGVWGWHLLGCAAVLYWVIGVCQMPLWQYVLLFAWPGLSLTLLRSFTEHRPVDALDQRTIIIEGSLLTRLLFLNNNYHQVHHSDPGLAWYRIADRFRQNRDRIIRENGGFYFRGYFDLFRNYLFRTKDSPVFPIMG